MTDSDMLQVVLLSGVSLTAVVVLVIYFRRDTVGQSNDWFLAADQEHHREPVRLRGTTL